MEFRDLREQTPRTPAYETTVVVRGDVVLARTICMNEAEAEAYILSCLKEELPLKVESIRVVHKSRPTPNSSLWESEFIATGKVNINKPMPREEIRKLVQDIVQRVGFENPSISVRSAAPAESGEEARTPSNRELADLASKVVRGRVPSGPAPISREDAACLKKGDRVVVHRMGFQEEAVVREVIPEDQMAEVSVESYATPVWVPFRKIIEIKSVPKKEGGSL